VRQAEENLHAASAQIGIANRLQSIALTANGGSAALAFSKMFTGEWVLGSDRGNRPAHF